MNYASWGQGATPGIRFDDAGSSARSRAVSRRKTCPLAGRVAVDEDLVQDVVICVADDQFARSQARGAEIPDAAGLVNGFACHSV